MIEPPPTAALPATSPEGRALMDGMSKDEALRRILADTKTIAVLGVKPESDAGKPAHDVPAYMARQGYELVPVPVYYPDVTHILGRPVHRSLVDAARAGKSVDLVNVFRRPQDIPAHLGDILAAKPKVVWFQLGIRHEEAARALEAQGIEVIQDRCILVEHRRLM